MPALSVSAGVFTQELPGYKSDLVISGGFGLLYLLLALLSQPKAGRRFSIPGVVLGIIAVFIDAALVYRVYTIPSSQELSGIFVDVTADVGGGVYLSFIGIILATVGCWLTVGSKPEVPASPSQSGPP